MRGYPKHLNSKADVEYVMEHYPKKAKPDVEALLAKRKAYLPVGPAKVGEIAGENQRVVVHEAEVEGEEVRVLEELQEDPNARVRKIGFADEDIIELESFVKKEVSLPEKDLKIPVSDG